MKRAILFLSFSIPILLQAQVKGIKHVILIGIDGLGTSYFKDADIPVMKSMMQKGTFS